MTLSRDRIVAALVAALEPLDFVNAVWQGGAVAFGRADQWSDIDLVIDAADDRCNDVWPAVESALAALSPIEVCFAIPAPPLGLHSQKFYRLRDAGPFLLVDVGVFPTSGKDKLLDSEVHGNAIVHFDRTGVTKQPPRDAADRAKEIAARVEQLRVTFPLFQSLVLKEIHRGRDIDAFAFYQAWAVRPLVELLRIRHCPQRYNFGPRYVEHDLPKDVVDRLRPLFFVRDLDDLRRRREEAEAWGNQLLAELPRGQGDA
jgi:hypothetical protein